MKEGKKKFLIIKTSALGDIIIAYPVVDYLLKKFPEAEIDWVVEATGIDLVHSHPNVHRAIPIHSKSWRKKLFDLETWRAVWALRKELRKSTYDAVFDLQGNTKSGLILSQTRSLNKVGFNSKSVPERPNLLFTNRKVDLIPGANAREDNLRVVSSFFGETAEIDKSTVTLNITPEQQAKIEELTKITLSKNSLNIMVCPGSAWPNKQLTTQTLAEFLSLIQQKLNCTFIFVWGSNAEKEITKELHQRLPNSHLIDRLPLPALQHLMDKCDLVITMDSMALHLASTTTTPTFSVFGPSLASKYNPPGDQHGTFQGQCPYGKTFPKRCPILRTCPTGACIHDLPAQQLFAAFNSWYQ